MLGNGIVVDPNLNLFTLLQACGVIKPFTNSNFYLIFGTETDIVRIEPGNVGIHNVWIYCWSDK